MAMPKILTAKRRRLFFKLIVIGFVQAGLTIVAALLIRYVFDHWVIQVQHEFGEPALVVIIALILTAVLGALMRYRERVTAEQLINCSDNNTS
jgi:ABC-type multidrug transport system fused ATPase/permease subunit